MARIAYPDLDRPSGLLTTLSVTQPLDNGLRMLAHCEAIVSSIAQLEAAHSLSLELSDRHRELVTLAVAHALGSGHLWNTHAVVSERCGVTARERDALRFGPHWQFTDVTFSAAENALLRFALEILVNGAVSNRVFTAMKAHFSARQVVEVISVVTHKFTMARLAAVLQLEEPGVEAAIGDQHSFDVRDFGLAPNAIG